MFIIKKVKKYINKFNAKKTRYRFLNKNKKGKNVMLFFIPSSENSIGGGLLSICSIYNETLNLKEIHGFDCYTVHLPENKSFVYKYNQFSNNLVLFNLNHVLKAYEDINEVFIQLPEIFIPYLTYRNKKNEYFYKWLEKSKKIKINILNQNEFLMPNIFEIDKLKKITENITITVAHEKYANIEKRNKYNLPIHLISPWSSPTPYLYKKFNEKENLILFSPDEIEYEIYNTSITAEQIKIYIKKILPHYKFITIQNIKYDDYKDLISKAKFTFTFGEGLDGYFVEPYFSGGVSFAVKNEIFFNKKYNNFTTIFESFEDLLKNIENKLLYYQNEENYNNESAKNKIFFEKIYSLDRLNNNLYEFYLENYDFK